MTKFAESIPRAKDARAFTAQSVRRSTRQPANTRRITLLLDHSTGINDKDTEIPDNVPYEASCPQGSMFWYSRR